VLVGFAAETGDLLAKARDKRTRKNVDLMVANDVTAPGAGFDVHTNAVTIIGADREEALPVQSKARVAEAILDRVEQLLKTRSAVAPAER
jgi:phosphopantothenoylcysteine decarboxylase/phosphopantothenate--cysteine ligase